MTMRRYTVVEISGIIPSILRFAVYLIISLRCISHNLKWNQDLTFHVSRHTWAVLALAHGAEISEISRLLGHASTGVTERVYAEFLPDNLAAVVSKLGFCFIPDINAKQKKVVSR